MIHDDNGTGGGPGKDESFGGQDGAKGGDHKAGEETTGPDHQLRKQPQGDRQDKADDGPTD